MKGPPQARRTSPRFAARAPENKTSEDNTSEPIKKSLKEKDMKITKPIDKNIKDILPKEPVQTVPELPYLEVPPLTEVIRPDTDARLLPTDISTRAPAYKTMAPVQEQLPAKKLSDEILDMEFTLTLRQLFGYSEKLCNEVKTELTPIRVPIKKSNNPMSQFMQIGPDNGYNLKPDYQVVSDPYWQFYQNGEREIPLVRYVGGETDNLRSVWPRINGIDHVEAILDSGSQIVSMAEAVAVQTGLSWDPEVVIDMQSANQSVDRTLGLARNVPFTFNGITVYLQVHIIKNPAYTILLGRPFNCLVRANVQDEHDGSAIMTIEDPNSKKRAVIPTYIRGAGPKQIVEKRKHDEKMKEMTQQSAESF